MQDIVITLLQKMFILTLQMAVPILLVGVVLGGFFYVSNVTGKYRGLWIALFVIGVLMGILGITVGLGLF